MAEPVTRCIELADAAATDALGRRIAQHMPQPAAGWLFLLQGDLGAGKSTLVRALLKALGHAGPVPSPTYTLVEPYELPVGTVNHVDLYRVAAADELEFLGWSDLRAGALFVEWPERVPALVDDADLLLKLAYAGNGRRAELIGLTPRAARWLAELPEFG